MSFLKRLFGGGNLDGEALARSDQPDDLVQIQLLHYFSTPQPLHDERAQRAWERALPRSYEDQIEQMTKQGWITVEGDTVEGNTVGNTVQTTSAAEPFLAIYRQRQQEARQAVMAQVRQALSQRDTSEALAIRRRYEAQQPLGRADWTGPDPQLSHSALTRRILFLEHWLVADLDDAAEAWLKLYAAEQHLWGASWRMTDVPAQFESSFTVNGMTANEMTATEGAYWRSRQLILYVENQETWQRCKGGDHVRRIEIQGPGDEATCDHCRQFYGEQYLVVRVPELPHRECDSVRGCRCEYVPVLETYTDLEEEL